MTRPPILVDKIFKSYGPVVALDDVSFEVKEGELFGLIGPDGAGKSSLFRILTTLVLPDRGTARVLDLDVINDYKAIRTRIGYMPGRFSLYQDLTVEENINFYATVFGTTLEANYHLIKDIYVQLEPFRNRPAGKLSGGMKQKLALCCALIHKPEVLFLDEPTTGVDPVSRKEFWQMLKRLQAEGIAMMVSTPYMDEAARCDRVALIQEGKLLTLAAPGDIGERFEGYLMALKSRRMFSLLRALRGRRGVTSCYAFGEYINAVIDKGMQGPEELVAVLKAEGFDDLVAKPVRPGIENVFMQLLAKTAS